MIFLYIKSHKTLIFQVFLSFLSKKREYNCCIFTTKFKKILIILKKRGNYNAFLLKKTGMNNHAKLMNTPYYGLGNSVGENSSNECGCYLFDNKPTEEKLTSIVSTEIPDLNNASQT